MTDESVDFTYYLDEEDEFLIVNRTLACAVGLHPSMVLRRVHKWVKRNRGEQSEDHLKDGVYWSYNTYEQWREKDFPFWSFDTVRRAFVELQKLGLLFVGNYNKRRGDQTKWYTVNYSAYTAFLKLWTHHKRPVAGEGRRSVAYQAFLEDWQAQRISYTSLATCNGQFGNLPSATLQLATTITNIDQQHKNTEKKKTKAVADAPAPSPADKESFPTQSKTSSKRQPKHTAVVLNPMKDAITTLFEWDWKTMTAKEKRLVSDAASSLVDAEVLPAQVPMLDAECKRRGWKNYGPTALNGTVDYAYGAVGEAMRRAYMRELRLHFTEADIQAMPRNINFGWSIPNDWKDES